MKGFDVLKVKSAVKARNSFDLSRTHLTTMDFGQIVPLLSEETIPGDEFSIDAEYFSRMAPLVKPTYGKFSFKTVAAFVPYHQIAVDSDAWFAGKTTWEGSTPHHRWLTTSSLAGFIMSSCVTSTGATATNTQFTYTDAGGTVHYNLWTTLGKYYIKVLNALGYAAPQGVDLRTSSDWTQKDSKVKLSAYPLLAFFKLYNDYMSQSQLFNTSQLSNILRCIKYGVTNTFGYNASTGELAATVLSSLFNWLHLQYENDYFTSAWQTPNNAIGSVENVSFGNVPNDGVTSLGSISDTTNDNVLTQGTNNIIGQRALDFLKSFDDWVRRNNYSGSRAVQQIYSRFGIKTDDYRSHYANVISTDTIPIQVGDITSSADTSLATLGEYAGKGIMNGNKNISVKVSDYGIILILGYYTIVPMNAFGFDRKVLRNAPLDYYNPEFDGMGADAISVGEVWSDPSAGTDGTLNTDVFGFTERYNAYRYGRDQITGEFRDYNPAGDMNVWHTGRNLESLRAAGELVAQGASFNSLPQTDSEFNRIFSVTSGIVDHFYMTARFNVRAIRPILNLNQVPRLGEGDTVVPRNGNTIS